MRRTEERIADDDAFVRLFRPALRRAYDEAKREKKSDQEFAESIGVDRPQMLRILEEGAMPSVRTVAFAYREYGISVPYRRVPLNAAIPGNGARPKPHPPIQLVLPFTIYAEKDVNLKLNSASEGKFELRLIVDRAG